MIDDSVFDYKSYTIYKNYRILDKNKYGNSIELKIEKEKKQIGNLRLCGLDHVNGFNKNDFFQHTFFTEREYKEQRIGQLIHDFLIDNQKVLRIDNVFSTNQTIDSKFDPNLKLSDEAIRFWERRVTINKAQFINEIGRYKIIFI